MNLHIYSLIKPSRCGHIFLCNQTKGKSKVKEINSSFRGIDFTVLLQTKKPNQNQNFLQRISPVYNQNPEEGMLTRL